MARTLHVRYGTLRVFDRAQWLQVRDAGGDEGEFEKIVKLRMPVSGMLRLLHREPSKWHQRICRAFPAYLWNRGLRDTWQWIFGPGPGAGKKSASTAPWWQRNLLWQGFDRLFSALKLATRAGEVRLLEYCLAFDWSRSEVSDNNPVDTTPYQSGGTISGRKRLTYGRKSNPWRQLMRLQLWEFPGLRQEDAVLQLDTSYLAREGVPLLRITGQHDQPGALADFASFAAYFVRLLLNVHVWSFRKPDAPSTRKPQRLPGDVEGLPKPQVEKFLSAPAKDGHPEAHVQLTRYKPSVTKGLPVLLIHGYSASGTTFAHSAVRPNLAEHLCGRGRDVWIADLRTSSGMETAQHAWTFEDAALVDLPMALARVLEVTKADKIDVFAHCMGAAMFSMAMLVPPPAPGKPALSEALTRFPDRIHRLVLSQIGPRVVMSAENVFRGYVMSYLRHFLPFAKYSFRPENPGLVDQLLDRLLATLPYPEEEFEIENPTRPCARTPFVGTRHRMDALYGRDFSLADKDGRPRLSDEVLEHIDDLFGPLNIDTVAQAIQFARFNAIADGAGNVYYSRERARKRWGSIPTLSIHGAENGLADVATLAHIRQYMQKEAGLPWQMQSFEGFGHQDSLIGKDAGIVFAAVSKFLDQEERDAQPPRA